MIQRRLHPVVISMRPITLEGLEPPPRRVRGRLGTSLDPESIFKWLVLTIKMTYGHVLWLYFNVFDWLDYLSPHNLLKISKRSKIGLHRSANITMELSGTLETSRDVNMVVGVSVRNDPRGDEA